MTPLEELQAAHKRLSELWNRTGGNYWQAGRNDPGEGWFYVQNADTGEDEIYTERGGNVDLIVTLHRTIDAQLALLDDGITWQMWLIGHVDNTGPSEHVMALARAINGEAS